MSISSALQTGVSGLQANSRAVGGISENIANANTIGYRRGFSQMVTTTASGGSGTGVLSVASVQRLDINSSGGLISTNSPTDMAIGGNGFFSVSLRPNETIQTNYLLTRAGSFLPDADGNLVNAAGYYLAGYPYDLSGSIGQVDRSSFAQMETVNVGNISLSAAATTSISARGNLPSNVSGDPTADPVISQTEYYTTLGASEYINFSWQSTANPNEWVLTLEDTNNAPLGSVTVQFHDSGDTGGTPASYSNITNLATAPSAFAFDATTGVATLTLNNGTDPQVLELDLGAPGTYNGITQFAGDSGMTFDRNGSSVGGLIRYEIDEAGTLFGVFDNGQRRPLYEIPVAVVANPHGMIEMKGNAYGLSGESGAFLASQANSGSVGAINAGALEAANVDISKEMTDLIEAQRAYSTNAKVVTTVDEMMEETTRLKR
ncbi:flagellar hook protein FlgE [Pelagimonas sp. KU-00592-HH]|uniref:flagellar hook protein FlgE n=1 Tax=Pelagimonas sp. KU-00592-HH TaxID=3127651 RepID=UPI0031031ECF